MASRAQARSAATVERGAVELVPAAAGGAAPAVNGGWPRPGGRDTGEREATMPARPASRSTAAIDRGELGKRIAEREERNPGLVERLLEDGKRRGGEESRGRRDEGDPRSGQPLPPRPPGRPRRPRRPRSQIRQPQPPDSGRRDGSSDGVRLSYGQLASRCRHGPLLGVAESPAIGTRPMRRGSAPAPVRRSVAAQI